MDERELPHTSSAYTRSKLLLLPPPSFPPLRNYALALAALRRSATASAANLELPLAATASSTQLQSKLLVLLFLLLLAPCLALNAFNQITKNVAEK